MLAVTEGPQLGWTSPFVVATGVAATVFGLVFVGVERRSDHPVFDFELLCRPTFFALCLIPVALAFSFVSLLVYLPVYFTAAYGLAPGTVGWIIVVMTVPVVLVPLLAGRLLAYGVESRWLLAVSMLLVTAGAATLLVVGPRLPVAVLVPGLTMIGAGMGLSAGILDGAAVGSVPPERAGTAAGMFNTSRLAGETIGVASVGTVLVGLVRRRLRGESALRGLDAGEAANQVLSGNIVDFAGHDQALTILLSEAFTGALRVVLGGMLVMSLITAAVVLLLMRESPSDEHGERERG